jgi:hypothetical protein
MTLYSSVNSSVNRGIYEQEAGAWGEGSQYIRRLRVTEEYTCIFYGFGTMEYSSVLFLSAEEYNKTE